MSAYNLLALAEPVKGMWQGYGWDPIPWFWLAMGLGLLVGFFLLAFRTRDLPHDEQTRRAPARYPGSRGLPLIHQRRAHVARPGAEQGPLLPLLEDVGDPAGAPAQGEQPRRRARR